MKVETMNQVEVEESGVTYGQLDSMVDRLFIRGI